jgi:hypothetical protein
MSIAYDFDPSTKCVLPSSIACNAVYALCNLLSAQCWWVRLSEWAMYVEWACAVDYKLAKPDYTYKHVGNHASIYDLLEITD